MNSVHRNVDPEAKLSKTDFLRKYNNQVRLWEMRLNGQLVGRRSYPHEGEYEEECRK